MKLFDTLVRSLETGIEVLAPAVASRREQAKSQLDLIKSKGKRSYDAAASGRRTEGWRKVQNVSPGVILGLKDIQSRSRDLVRNNGYAKKGVGGIVSNTIGTGIMPQFRIGTVKGQVRKKLVEKKWMEWFTTTACDFDELHNGYGLQRLVMRTVVEQGEVIVRQRILDPKTTGKRLPLQLQVLECDYLDTSKDGDIKGGGTIASGIEFNSDGQRVAYHIYRQHPGSTQHRIVKANLSVRVPAGEIIHLFRVDRPGQIRGVPWTAAIMLNLRDLDDYEDAELLRRKVSAVFAGFIQTDNLGDSLGVGVSKPPLVDKMEPGMMQELAPGESITFNNPPVGGDYSQYTTSMLHKVAAGLEIPHCVLTGNYSEINFSSGRMGWLEFQRLIEEWRWLMIVPRFLDILWGWFEMVSMLVGNDFSDIGVDWTAPRREMIDPSKEIPAIVATVRAGFMSLPEAIREFGYDPETVIAECQEFNAKLDAAKVIFDTDPRVENNQVEAKNLAAQTLAEKQPVQAPAPAKAKKTKALA